MAVIVQIAGIKRWQLWRPMFPSPMREYQESFRVWDPGFIPQWEAAGPDLEVDLQVGSIPAPAERVGAQPSCARRSGPQHPPDVRDPGTHATLGRGEARRQCDRE
ncbi:hypothetical protein ACH4L7_22900 [Streptomyces anulatus]